MFSFEEKSLACSYIEIEIQKEGTFARTEEKGEQQRLLQCRRLLGKPNIVHLTFIVDRKTNCSRTWTPNSGYCVL